MNLIQQLEQEEIARLNKDIPEFAPGDTVVVSVRVVENAVAVCKPTKALSLHAATVV